jgi:hypothetical protein
LRQKGEFCDFDCFKDYYSQVKTGKVNREGFFMATPFLMDFWRKQPVASEPSAGRSPDQAKNGLVAGIMLILGWNRAFDGPMGCRNGPARTVRCPGMGQTGCARRIWQRKPSLPAGRRDKLDSARNFFMVRLLSRMESLKN